jgi:regulator of cell morphogenesis and NO signaling
MLADENEEKRTKEAPMAHLMTVERELDASELTTAEAGREAISRFDALAPGEKLVLVAGGGAREILLRIQKERPGLFEWSVLEAGPTTWRTEIARREEPGPRGVEESLGWDHDRLEALEDAAFRARAAGDLPMAFDLFAQFASGLKRHIGVEEDLVFPAFENASGMSQQGGPTAVMRSEHREIEKILEAIASSIGDAAENVEPLRAQLHAALSDHNIKEERVLYPETDALLGPEGSDLLVLRIQAYGIRPGLR